MKQMKIIFSLMLLQISLCFVSCQYYSYGLDEVFYRDNSIRNRSGHIQNFNELFTDSLSDVKRTLVNSGDYEVLVFTDVHFGGENQGKNKRRYEEDLRVWLRGAYADPSKPSKLAFCICLGDVAEHGIDSEFEDYVSFTNSLKSEFDLVTFNVVGNHDLYNAGWKGYKKMCFPYSSFYKFRTKNMTFYFLDSASGSLGDEQLMSFKRDMEYTEDGRKKVVFTHVPAYAGGHFYFVMQNTIERNKLISFCAKNDVVSFVCGHTHKEITSDIGFKEYNLPGFLEDHGFGILSVDEEAGTAKSRCIYLD